jgi:hypothetical protein
MLFHFLKLVVDVTCECCTRSVLYKEQVWWHLNCRCTSFIQVLASQDSDYQIYTNCYTGCTIELLNYYYFLIIFYTKESIKLIPCKKNIFEMIPMMMKWCWRHQLSVCLFILEVGEMRHDKRHISMVIAWNIIWGGFVSIDFVPHGIDF